VAELITKTLARKLKAATHWSVRAIAKETGIAKSNWFSVPGGAPLGQARPACVGTIENILHNPTRLWASQP
jgi:hypothetical protein